MISATHLLRVLVLPLVLVATCLGLRAAPEAPARTFRIFTVIHVITDLKYDAAPGKSTPLVISQVPFASLPIPRDNHVVLYKEIPPPADSPPGTPPVKVVMADALVPADAPRVLIAVIPDDSGRFSTRVIPDDPAQHPVGQLRFINLSKFHAALGLNREQYRLGPAEFALLGWPKDGGILVQVAANKNGEWESVLRRERRARKSARSYCIVFDYAPNPEELLPDPMNPPPVTVRFFFENVTAIPAQK